MEAANEPQTPGIVGPDREPPLNGDWAAGDINADMPDQTPPTFEIQTPTDLEAGTYANFLSVWHSPFEFTLDFAVIQQPTIDESEDEDEATVTVPCRVVARVKLPPTVVFDVLRALNENMTRFEATYGAIKRPGAAEEERGDDYDD